MAEKQDLANAQKLARSLDSKVMETLQQQKAKGPRKDISGRFDEILARYEKVILDAAGEPDGVGDSGNLFALVGARHLAEANRYSRIVSTHLGSAWEEMAGQSHLALSPEIDLGTRILGIDVIVLDGTRLRHTQIKTQRNTLTGAQKPRAVSELSLHPHPLFAAAFGVSSWTFSHATIERVAGEDFWAGKLGIPYPLVLDAARRSITRIENALFA